MTYFYYSSAYGETVFLLIQTWIIAYLVLYYGGQTATALGYSAVVAAGLSFLMSPAAPLKLLVFLQSSVMLNIAAARVSTFYMLLCFSTISQRKMCTNAVHAYLNSQPL